jgi:hypothetical protein
MTQVSHTALCIPLSAKVPTVAILRKRIGLRRIEVVPGWQRSLGISDEPVNARIRVHDLAIGEL